MGRIFLHLCYNSNVYIVRPRVFAYSGVGKQVGSSPFSGFVVYGEGAQDTLGDVAAEDRPLK